MFHLWPGDRVVLPAASYDLPKTIADTIWLGEAPMAMVPDLGYRNFQPAMSAIKRHDTCEDLQVTLNELH